MPPLNESSRDVSLEDLAAAFGYSTKQFMRKLALIGWNAIMYDAERIAADEVFQRNVRLPDRHPDRKLWDGRVSWEHLRDAAAQHVKPKVENPVLKSPRAGWLYVLYDADSGLCKIGCTAGSGRQRQRAIMGSHGHELLNLLNARVEDRFAVERQCHEHFKELRRNGEWFAVAPELVIAYVYEHVEWDEFDSETAARLGKAILDAQQRREHRHRETRNRD